VDVNSERREMDADESVAIVSRKKTGRQVPQATMIATFISTILCLILVVSVGSLNEICGN
jgi:hypothetical protein